MYLSQITRYVDYNSLAYWNLTALKCVYTRITLLEQHYYSKTAVVDCITRSLSLKSLDTHEFYLKPLIPSINPVMQYDYARFDQVHPSQSNFV